MSRNNGKGPRLDLKLNLSQPRGNPSVVMNSSPSRSRSSTSSSQSSSPPSSCVSSETEAGSPEATSMVLVGCPRCLMYVMLSEDDPKCPKCKSTVLLDFNNPSTDKKRGSSVCFCSFFLFFLRILMLDGAGNLTS